VIIADAVTVGRDPQACHAFHEAGGKPSETPVAERGVRLGRSEPIEVHAEIPERRLIDFAQPKIAEHIGEQPPD
jgi:hypothetical protein